MYLLTTNRGGSLRMPMTVKVDTVSTLVEDIMSLLFHEK